MRVLLEWSHMVPTIGELARQLMAPGKGVLAADESPSTMHKRLTSIEVEDTGENARRFRELLFTAQGLGEYISGVIMYDASMRRSTSDGTPFPHLLEQKGVMPGIKVDTGHGPLANFPGEEVSYGLEGLDARLDEYYGLGARFTKFRSVIAITDDLPSETCLRANAQVLARYAAEVQAHNMVPMVEPEVLFDGTHTLERSGEVLRQTLATVFEELAAFRVDLSGLVLKTSMALPGKESGIELDPVAIGKETVEALRDSVPKRTAGVVFLSGGQTPLQATENLNMVAAHGKLPWPVTFSYSRAIEEPVLDAWRGDDANVAEAQAALTHRLALNVAAREGTYRKEME